MGLLVGLCGLPLFGLIDNDGDGISDVWSALHPTAGAPDADPDGDGTNNRAEAVAGTDPTSAASHFAADPHVDSSGNLVLSWQGIAGKRYRIESTTDLGTWVGQAEAYSGADAELTTIVRAAGTSGPARQFWRVVVFDLDTDGDGLNHWEEIQQGTDPLDFYNGHSPKIAVHSAPSVNDHVVKVSVVVTDVSGRPLANAPVVLTLPSGHAAISAGASEGASAQVTLRTDASGSLTVGVDFDSSDIEALSIAPVGAGANTPTTTVLYASNTALTHAFIDLGTGIIPLAVTPAGQVTYSYNDGTLEVAGYGRWRAGSFSRLSAPSYRFRHGLFTGRSGITSDGWVYREAESYDSTVRQDPTTLDWSGTFYQEQFVAAWSPDSDVPICYKAPLLTGLLVENFPGAYKSASNLWFLFSDNANRVWTACDAKMIDDGNGGKYRECDLRYYEPGGGFTICQSPYYDEWDIKGANSSGVVFGELSLGLSVSDFTPVSYDPVCVNDAGQILGDYEAWPSGKRTCIADSVAAPLLQMPQIPGIGWNGFYTNWTPISGPLVLSNGQTSDLPGERDQWGWMTDTWLSGFDNAGNVYGVIGATGPVSGMNNVIWVADPVAWGLPVETPAYSPIPWEIPKLPDGYTSLYGIRPGARQVELGLATKSGDSSLHAFMLIPASLAVDANRDGTIKLASEDATDATTEDKPFRFWLNDDIASGDTGGDSIPGHPEGDLPDYSTISLGDTGAVCGTRDLVDYFPVFLDIKQLLTVLPPTSGVKYKLKQADGAVNVVFTNLTRATAFSYLKPATGPLSTGFGPELTEAAGSATKYHVAAEGLELFVQSPAFLNCILNNDGGVILLDGRKVTTNPLVLSVEKDGNVIAEVKLELSLSSVEDMYRHLNLRNGPDAPSGLIGSTGSGHDALPTKMDERTAFPDAPGEAKWLFFVHGYNVSGEKARGWNAEMFKRFYWSNSRARFVGVYWFGNPGTGINLVQGYHWAVRNAAPSAQALAARLNALPGSKTVIGHSQGCWVTALAVADYGLTIGNLCLVDAAFARECFDGEGATDIAKMVPDVWLNSPDATWSANWHQLFYINGAPSSDARSTLTWRNRLVAALGTTAVHSFYSSTEDVLASYAGTPTQAIVDNAFHAISDTSAVKNFAWVVQEKTKGDKVFYSQGSAYGGWGFNLTDPADPADPIYYWADSSAAGGCKRAPLSSFPDPAATFGRELYKRAPLFDPGFGPQVGCMRWYEPARDQRGPSWLPDLFNGGTGSAIVAANRSELLAEAFPSLSLPLGANASDRIPDGQEHNMPASYVAGQRWPSARGFDTNSGLPNWHHSDIREVAYLYTFQFFDRIKAISESTP